MTNMMFTPATPATPAQIHIYSKDEFLAQFGCPPPLRKKLPMKLRRKLNSFYNDLKDVASAFNKRSVFLYRAWGYATQLPCQWINYLWEVLSKCNWTSHLSIFLTLRSLKKLCKSSNEIHECFVEIDTTLRLKWITELRQTAKSLKTNYIILKTSYIPDEAGLKRFETAVENREFAFTGLRFTGHLEWLAGPLDDVISALSNNYGTYCLGRSSTEITHLK